jgi:hypothetical protein
MEDWIRRIKMHELNLGIAKEPFGIVKDHDTIRAEARAEALRKAADRLRMTFFRDTGLYGYDGAKSNVDALNECETLCAAITQEPKP